ncbi:phosphatidylinositol 5-phosphate 4-kinase type-2 gamma, partial [Phasianus colchicus]|uniref:phosphatidylinositol 5-phosphate 4-kinase type-2 gamma n=1 Tax=Phasianus colchicus TaxID=9054 RepID=UPI00129E50F3
MAAAAAAAAAAAGPAAPRTKTKKKQKRFVPQRVKVPRAADPLLAVLAWGVNHQINELSQVPPPVMLLPDDFKASSKIKVNNHLFNRNGGEGRDLGMNGVRGVEGLDAPPPREGDVGWGFGGGGGCLTCVPPNHQGKELPTLKDVDFLNKSEKVYVGEEDKRDFMEKLKRDVEFLVQLKIMDYSLLLGIHEAGRPAPEEEEDGEEEEGGGGGGGDDGGGTAGSYGTSPEGIGAYFNCHRPPGPGEFDPTIDVYAIRSAEGEEWGGGR